MYEKITLKNRDFSLDIIRSIACFLVVLNHSVESFFNLEDYETAITYNNIQGAGIVLLFTIGRLGVPLFLMLTGYLLLDRDYEKPGEIKRFWLHNLLSLVITYEVWIVIYNIFLSFYNGEAFDTEGFIRQLTFTGKPDVTNSWYLPMIIGVFIFIPFLAKGIKNIPQYAFYIMLAVSYAAFYVVPSINVFFAAHNIETLSLQSHPVFWATNNAVFVLLGHMFHKRKKSAIKFGIFIEMAVVAAGLFVSVILQIYLHANGSQYNIWYSFFTLPPIGYCLFSLLKRINLKATIFKRISICSFGVYLIHRPLQMCMEKDGSYFSMITAAVPDIWTMWLLCVISFFISYGVTEGVGHIPFVGDVIVRVRKNKKNRL